MNVEFASVSPGLLGELQEVLIGRGVYAARLQYRLIASRICSAVFGPDVWAWVLVPGVDPLADVGVQGADGAVCAAAQELGGELAEPADRSGAVGP